MPRGGTRDMSSLGKGSGISQREEGVRCWAVRAVGSGPCGGMTCSRRQKALGLAWEWVANRTLVVGVECCSVNCTRFRFTIRLIYLNVINRVDLPRALTPPRPLKSEGTNYSDFRKRRRENRVRN